MVNCDGRKNSLLVSKHASFGCLNLSFVTRTTVDEITQAALSETNQGLFTARRVFVSIVNTENEFGVFWTSFGSCILNRSFFFLPFPFLPFRFLFCSFFCFFFGFPLFFLFDCDLKSFFGAGLRTLVRRQSSVVNSEQNFSNESRSGCVDNPLRLAKVVLLLRLFPLCFNLEVTHDERICFADAFELREVFALDTQHSCVGILRSGSVNNSLFIQPIFSRYGYFTTFVKSISGGFILSCHKGMGVNQN
mmetsp:Transcript_19130/g.37769  ORF Transcript_19130/g.37769 Transcript_19130/m.37769 type:complete len:248 (+) Transcript_19130:1627-2370(+)